MGTFSRKANIIVFSPIGFATPKMLPVSNNRYFFYFFIISDLQMVC